MTLEMKIPKCCCFTGHRENKLQRSEKEILEDLKQAINQAIDDGYTTFITGMAYGVDIWVGELVLKKRFWNRNIKLIAAIPFAGFESRWKDRYHKLLNKADEVHYICDCYSKYAYQKRNEWMVDRYARVIAVYNGEPSGTGNTINYAKKVGVPAVYIQA